MRDRDRRRRVRLTPPRTRTSDDAAFYANLKEIERLARHYSRAFNRMHREAGEVFESERRMEANREEIVALAMEYARNLPMDHAQKEAMIRAAVADLD